jgi:hypothetical protein
MLMRTASAILILVIWLSTISLAESVTCLSQDNLPAIDSNNWELVEDNRKESAYIDTDGIERPSPDVIKVWFKVTKEIGRSRFILQRFEFSCEERKYRVLRVATYDANGKVVSDRLIGGANKWKSIKAETFGEALLGAACK